jgi:hypothetical protein
MQIFLKKYKDGRIFHIRFGKVCYICGMKSSVLKEPQRENHVFKNLRTRR